MKSFKNIVLLAGILIMSVKAYSQIPAFVFDVTANQCFTYAATPNSYTLDSVMVVTPPLHGTLTAGNGTFVYCPQQGFTGYDTAEVFACILNGGFVLTCDTLDIVFNVSINCAMPVTLVQDSGICAGGNRSHTGRQCPVHLPVVRWLYRCLGLRTKPGAGCLCYRNRCQRMYR